MPNPAVARKACLDLTGLVPNPLPRPIRPWFESLAAEVLALRRLDRLYGEVSAIKNPCEFARAALERIGARFEVRTEEQFHIPVSGSAVVVANHPFGGLEGLFMVWLLRCLRDDVRILTNVHLNRIPELNSLFIPVSPFGGAKATRENTAGLRQALRWVKGGGLLLVFPAGEVSHFDPRSAAVCDPPWSPVAARLIRLAQAPVVPVYFDGRNSLRFQLAGLVHPILRTALLPRELLNKNNVRVPVRIGRPMPFENLRRIEDDAALARHLRIKTYMLAADLPARTPAPSVVPQHQSIIDAIPADRLSEEIARLPEQQRITSSGSLQVWHASAQQAPWLLQEIGRLRELTFRAVGEGTGRSADIDLYDDYYEHLFVWNAERAELVGAYRLGHADTICGRFGKRGLYTSTLFDFRGPLLKKLDPALELGRSFVRPEYQKSFTALLLLWKGISEYVARHPRYCVLFGAVSISNDYAAVSKEMLVRYLRLHSYQTRHARLVKGKQPFRGRHDLRMLSGELRGLTDIEALSALISEVEPDGKGVPVLLRQYLKLGGQILGFNVDPGFSNSVDCLIMVDLRATGPRVLSKYMGREGAEAFLKFHMAKPPLNFRASINTGCVQARLPF